VHTFDAFDNWGLIEDIGHREDVKKVRTIERSSVTLLYKKTLTLLFSKAAKTRKRQYVESIHSSEPVDKFH
jgi:hypothetical protein